MPKTLFVPVDFSQVSLTKRQLEDIMKNSENIKSIQDMVTDRNQAVLNLGNEIATTSERVFIRFFQNHYVDASLNALFTLFKFPTMGYFQHQLLGRVITDNDTMLSFVSSNNSKRFEWPRRVSEFIDYEGDKIRTVETLIPKEDQQYLTSLIPERDIKNGAKDFHHYVDGKEIMGYPVVDGFFANQLMNQFLITLALQDVPNLLKNIESWKKGEKSATQVLKDLGFRVGVNVAISFLSAFSNLIIMSIIQSFAKKATPTTYTITFIARLASAYGVHSLRNFIILGPQKETVYEINQTTP